MAWSVVNVWAEPGAATFHQHRRYKDRDPRSVRRAPTELVAMLEWHVARTEPMKGFIAERWLKDKKFNVFLPKVKEERRWSRGRTNETVKPLVSGYLFVNFDSDGIGWQRINDAPGVVALIYSAPEVPVRIPDNQMLPLLGICEHDEDDNWFVPKAQAQRFVFQVGQLVKVMDGPFAGFPGRVVAATFEKVKAEVFIFGRETQLEGDSKMFEPA